MISKIGKAMEEIISRCCAFSTKNEGKLEKNEIYGARNIENKRKEPNCARLIRKVSDDGISPQLDRYYEETKGKSKVISMRKPENKEDCDSWVPVGQEEPMVEGEWNDCSQFGEKQEGKNIKKSVSFNQENLKGMEKMPQVQKRRTRQNRPEGMAQQSFKLINGIQPIKVEEHKMDLSQFSQLNKEIDEHNSSEDSIDQNGNAMITPCFPYSSFHQDTNRPLPHRIFSNKLINIYQIIPQNSPNGTQNAPKKRSLDQIHPESGQKYIYLQSEKKAKKLQEEPEIIRKKILEYDRNNDPKGIFQNEKLRIIRKNLKAVTAKEKGLVSEKYKETWKKKQEKPTLN